MIWAIKDASRFVICIVKHTEMLRYRNYLVLSCWTTILNCKSHRNLNQSCRFRNSAYHCLTNIRNNSRYCNKYTKVFRLQSDNEIKEKRKRQKTTNIQKKLSAAPLNIRRCHNSTLSYVDIVSSLAFWNVFIRTDRNLKNAAF